MDAKFAQWEGQHSECTRPPPSGFSKMNVDGAVSRGTSGSASAVARDSIGTYLGSSAVMFDGVNDPEILESLACREGLSLAADLHLSHVKVASDCKGLISDLTKGSLGHNSTVIEEIKRRAQSFSSSFFTHEGRRSNNEAHMLAKHTISLAG